MVLNKGDLVSEDQQADIVDKIALLNPRAKIVKSVESKIDVMEILDTRLYQADKEKEDFWVTASKVQAEEKIEAAILECCERSLAKDGKKCCKSKRKNENLVDTGISQVGCFSRR